MNTLGPAPPAPADPAGAMLARLADGDRGTGRDLFTAIWTPVRRLTGRMLPVPADADDAAQETMLTLVERAADYDRTRPGLAWALTLARFASLTARKARQRRAEVPEAQAAPHAAHLAGDLAADIEARERIATAMAAIATLAPVDRGVLLEARDDDAPASATVRKRRQRALARARGAVRRARGCAR